MRACIDGVCDGIECSTERTKRLGACWLDRRWPPAAQRFVYDVANRKLRFVRAARGPIWRRRERDGPARGLGDAAHKWRARGQQTAAVLLADRDEFPAAVAHWIQSGICGAPAAGADRT